MKVKQGELAVMEATRQSNIGSILWTKMHQEALDTVRDAVAALKPLGGGPVLIDALTMQARLESEPVSMDPATRQKQLSTALDTLTAAEALATECCAVARPANLRADLRLTADERLAKVKRAQASALVMLAHEERFHPWALKSRPQIPPFPLVEGRDAEPVKAFLDPVRDLPDGGEDPVIRREDMALLSASAAAQLTKDITLRADAQAVQGRALRIAADKAQQTVSLWPPKPPLPVVVQNDTLPTVEGSEVADEPAESPPPPDPYEAMYAAAMVEPEGENILRPARDALEAALATSLAAGNMQAAGDAARDLCICIGDSEPQRAVELLNIHQSCKAATDMKQVFQPACNCLSLPIVFCPCTVVALMWHGSGEGLCLRFAHTSYLGSFCWRRCRLRVLSESCSASLIFWPRRAPSLPFPKPRPQQQSSCRRSQWLCAG